MPAPMTTIEGSFDAPYNENIYFEWALEGMFYPMVKEFEKPTDENIPAVAATEDYVAYSPYSLMGTVTDISFDMFSDARPDQAIIDFDIRGISADLEDVIEAAEFLGFIAYEIEDFLADAVDYLDYLMPTINIAYSHSGETEMRGSQFYDIFIGGSEVTSLKGRGGDDALVATADGAKAVGGSGNDAILLVGLSEDPDQNGNGGAGNDVLVSASAGSIIKGGKDDDVLVALDDARVDGGSGDDFLLAGLGDSTLLGKDGNDVFGIAFGYEPFLEEFLFGGDSDWAEPTTTRTAVVEGSTEDHLGGEGPYTDTLINDFDAHEDQLFFIAAPLDIASPEEAYEYFMDYAVQDGKNVVFDDGEARFTLRKTDLESISEGNFTDYPFEGIGSSGDIPFDDLIPYDLLFGGLCDCTDSIV